MDGDQTLKKVSVELGENSYEIQIGAGALHLIGEELIKLGFKPGCRILLVSQPVIADFYAQPLLHSLNLAGFLAELFLIPSGEDQKNLNTISEIHNAAYQHQLERSSLMIALGGGVIGDMTGFAAATWLRGIAVVQVPTTLLAMVDASIGGKTGVNHPGGKNLIGAFHQPKLVLIDPSTLNTLPTREVRAGLAEVIKYGVIGDAVLFEALEQEDQLEDLDAIGESLLLQILKRSVSAKARVVAADEREGNLRAILNYGHTLGHVVETLTGYETYLHGEAVAIGMLAAGELSTKLGLWPASDQQRQKQLIKRCGLPLSAPKFPAEAVRNCLLRDKKVSGGRVRFVLANGIGTVEIRNDVPLELAIDALAGLSFDP
jgi:3-dehydroquinate synthase